ncbi:MAG: translation initiation factor 2 [Mesorhizobium sp.]|uniref:translation initiation factor 2 n=1 Tax=Mesorhizobium sp. TaxID=1871066 RepID=UPI00120AD8CE|nr:translation initiation factor 2 [Mesorhizobium sp.]TIL73102.1 MAG: translation initiation factor 2 [Mesorhizobium sp.]TIL88314.1 MAG: translation initiation factor 2 [Mesorhizobium sp.]TIL99414.1 MAG: translation initiation factor 2 [Mesorhizobium sp.]TIN16890.1 MAG: translation initiation factor 2 [Mesorhizobium sp.]
MKIHLCAALAATVAMTGCASVVRGTTDKVSINSEPPDSTIRTSLGHSCPSSPCTVEVSRKEGFTAFAEKEGYKPGSLYIGTSMSGKGAAGLAGNILVGGLVGVGVDAMTGATLDHSPNPALITLIPTDAPGESSKAIVPPPEPPAKNNSSRAGV